MKTTGLVMGIEKNMVIVLTNCGYFRRLPKKGHVEIGEEYSYSDAAGYRSWLAAASILVMLVSSVLLASVRGIPAAFVSVDINPSLELAVSRSGKVLSAEALNREATIILQELAVKGLKLEHAISLIYQEAQSRDFIGSDKAFVLLAAVPAGGRTELPRAVSGVITALSSSRPAETEPVFVAAVLTTPQLRETAKASGLSMGKLAVYLEARGAGHPLEIAALKQEGIIESLFEDDKKPVESLRRIEHNKDIAVLTELVRTTVAQAEKDSKEGITVTIVNAAGEEEKLAKPETGVSQNANAPKPKEQAPEVTQPEPPAVPNPAESKGNTVEPVSEPAEAPATPPAEVVPIPEEVKHGLLGWLREIFIQ